MKVHLHNFFNDLDLSAFYRLFELVFQESIELGTAENSDILFESVFGSNTLLYTKKWRCSILFIGESDRRLPIFMGNRMHTLKDYSCVLKGSPDNGNIVCFPLYLLYIESFGLSEKFLKPNARTDVPPKDVCVIISNGSDQEGRNEFCERLGKRVSIDYAGAYKNNVQILTAPYFSREFVEFVSQYKFVITMENSKNETYITEKILHGFTANTVPVYWGSDRIGEHFNEDRFINVSSFQETDACIERIVELIQDPAKYLNMCSRPIYNEGAPKITIHTIAKSVRKMLFRPKHVFMTFGGPTENYHRSMIRICNEAQRVGVFDDIRGYSEESLNQDQLFWSNHGSFIEQNSRGYGYWLWKPYLINRELERLQENDILVYCDAGCRINPGGKTRLLEYVDMLNVDPSSYGIVSFQLEYKEKQYTKQSVLEYFGVSEEDRNQKQCMATVVIIRKTAHSSRIINLWFKTCQKHYLINDDRKEYENREFVDHRHDQSILSVIVNKEGSIKLSDETWFHPNWDKDGANYPFWAMRLK